MVIYGSAYGKDMETRREMVRESIELRYRWDRQFAHDPYSRESQAYIDQILDLDEQIDTLTRALGCAELADRFKDARVHFPDYKARFEQPEKKKAKKGKGSKQDQQPSNQAPLFRHTTFDAA